VTAVENMIAAKIEQGLHAARDLAAHGIPLFTADPATKDGQWDPRGGHGGCGYWLPKGWQHSPADPAVVDTWRVGMALGAVMGHGLDLLDVDPRHGGEAARAGLKAAGLWPRSYATAATPSGGTHDFIASLGVSSRDAVADGLDVKAGVDGDGHGFAFIAPTVRMSKVTGELLPYHWLSLPNLDSLGEHDDTGAGIAEMVRAVRSGSSSGWTDPELDELVAHGIPDGAAQHAVLRDVVWKLRTQGAARSVARLTWDAIVAKTTLTRPSEPWSGQHFAAHWDSADGKIPPGPTVVGEQDQVDRGEEEEEDGGDDDNLREQHLGQVRMAYRLAAAHRDRLLYVHRIGWHYWDGQRWAEDDQGAAQRAVLAVLKTALRKSLGNPKLRTDVTKCESATGVAGVLAIASALTAFAATVRDLDQDPYLLNVANGTLDLRTMQLREHDPRDRITKVTRAGYDPEADPAIWDTFIAAVLPDEQVRRFLQRLIGLALLGKVIEHILPILTGIGANGKGTTYKALLWALGDYADTVDPDLFMVRDHAHPTGEMDLRGLRLVAVSESDRDRRLAEATMKRLTGGDIIKARRMRQDFVSFEPSHLALFITNHLPTVSGDDPAVWRRIRVVPFDVVFTESEQDKDLDDRLRLEADAILTWAVHGYADYLEAGLAEPEAVLKATTSYKLTSDAIARFIDERCHLAGRTAAKTLFEAFSSWCAAEGLEAGSQTAFGKALDERGFPAMKSSSKFRVGLTLLAEEDA
jgi:putative DNA primase/helicase